MNGVKHSAPHVIVTSFIIIFCIVYLSKSIFINVHSGEGAVLWRRFFGGTVTDKVFGEGMHMIFPWDKMTVYNVRLQQVVHDFDVLTKNGLRIHLSISIRYKPEYLLLGVLHQRVGPDYANKVVVPEIEQVLRVIVGRLDAEQVYRTETVASPIQRAVNEGIEQVGQRFIKIDDVIIKEVVLPPLIEEAISFKVQQKHVAAAYEFILLKEQREAERKKIEAGGIKTYNEIVNVSLSDRVLKWKGIQATLELSQSNNSKVVVIGGGKDGLPIIGNIPMETIGGLGVSEAVDDVATPPDEGIDHLKDYAPDGGSDVKGPPEATGRTAKSDVE